MNSNLNIFYNREFDKLFSCDLMINSDSTETSFLEGCNLISKIDSLLLAAEYVCDIDDKIELLQEQFTDLAEKANQCISDFQYCDIVGDLKDGESLNVVLSYFKQNKENGQAQLLQDIKKVDWNNIKLLLKHFNDVINAEEKQVFDCKRVLVERFELALKFWQLPNRDVNLEYIITVLNDVVVLLQLSKFINKDVDAEQKMDKVINMVQNVITWKNRVYVGEVLDELKEKIRDLSERNTIRKMKHENELVREQLHLLIDNDLTEMVA